MSRAGAFGNNNNWAGVGGLDERPWDRWRVGDPGRPQCGARCKRTGKPCPQPPVRGRARCRFHGGFGGGRNRRLAKSERALLNKEARVARKVAREELAATVLHPDTSPVLARTYLSRIYPPDLERFTVELDRYLKGEIDYLAWRATRRAFGV
jgi:hypothetical protein